MEKQVWHKMLFLQLDWQFIVFSDSQQCKQMKNDQKLTMKR